MITNSLDEEKENRHSSLLSELLAVMCRHAGTLGHTWVEVVHQKEIRLHTRYYTTERPYEIIQTLTLENRSVPLERNPQ